MGLGSGAGVGYAVGAIANNGGMGAHAHISAPLTSFTHAQQQTAPLPRLAAQAGGGYFARDSHVSASSQFQQPQQALVSSPVRPLWPPAPGVALIQHQQQQQQQQTGYDQQQAAYQQPPMGQQQQQMSTYDQPAHQPLLPPPLAAGPPVLFSVPYGAPSLSPLIVAAPLISRGCASSGAAAVPSWASAPPPAAAPLNSWTSGPPPSPAPHAAYQGHGQGQKQGQVMGYGMGLGQRNGQQEYCVPFSPTPSVGGSLGAPPLSDLSFSPLGTGGPKMGYAALAPPSYLRGARKVATGSTLHARASPLEDGFQSTASNKAAETGSGVKSVAQNALAAANITPGTY